MSGRLEETESLKGQSLFHCILFETKAAFLDFEKKQGYNILLISHWKYFFKPMPIATKTKK